MDSDGQTPLNAGNALQGQTVLITRPLQQADELREMLEAHGATVMHIPAVEIQASPATEELDAALRELNGYHWLLFTSANGVEYFFRRAAELRLPEFEETVRQLRVCAIGPATQAAAESHGLTVELVPAEYVAESLADAFAAVPLEGQRVLLPRAAVARDVALDALRERGAAVDAVEAYRSGVPESSREAIAGLVEAGTAIDWVAFTSSSTVKNFLAMGGGALLKTAHVACIGPITSETARKHSLHVDAEAVEHTAEGLVAAIASRSKP